MPLSVQEYREKVLGCWIGKNVGGTIGAPFEWKRQVNHVTFYPQKNLNGTPMPNDDLDIQLLWLVALEETGLNVTAHKLAEYWLTYVTPHWCEYGTAKINLRQGLQPPLSGSFSNVYKHSCGAYIRSEIWACIAPGRPSVAAAFAYEDAIIDHGDGEGMYAEVFMAALESAAFVVSDLRQLIEIGLSYIPTDCGVTQAVRTTLECFDAGKTWLELRDVVLEKHRGSTAFGDIHQTSPEDRAKGFHEGVLGYDVPSNIAFTLAGLLYGGEDFGQVQCICVNLGEDTDCTAATAGSIWGIIHGAKAIPQKWIDPIGRGIKTVCLNLGELGYFGDLVPQSVDELTERTVRIARRVLAQHGVHAFEEQSSIASTPEKPQALQARDHGQHIWAGKCGPKHVFDFFNVQLDYLGLDPVIRAGEARKLRVIIYNRYKTQANLSLHWHLPEGWTVSPGVDGYALSFPHCSLALDVELMAPTLTQSTYRATLEITIAGRHTAMLVPVTLLNGSYLAKSS